MPKSTTGRRPKLKDSHRAHRKATSESGETSRTSETLFPEAPVPEAPERKESLLPKTVQAVETNGMDSLVTTVDIPGNYSISVRQANALIAELEHCWITDQIVTNLVMDLVRWLNAVR